MKLFKKKSSENIASPSSASSFFSGIFKRKSKIAIMVPAVDLKEENATETEVVMRKKVNLTSRTLNNMNLMLNEEEPEIINTGESSKKYQQSSESKFKKCMNRNCCDCCNRKKSVDSEYASDDESIKTLSYEKTKTDKLKSNSDNEAHAYKRETARPPMLMPHFNEFDYGCRDISIDMSRIEVPDNNYSNMFCWPSVVNGGYHFEEKPKQIWKSQKRTKRSDDADYDSISIEKTAVENKQTLNNSSLLSVLENGASLETTNIKIANCIEFNNLNNAKTKKNVVDADADDNTIIGEYFALDIHGQILIHLNEIEIFEGIEIIERRTFFHFFIPKNKEIKENTKVRRSLFQFLRDLFYGNCLLLLKIYPNLHKTQS